MPEKPYKEMTVNTLRKKKNFVFYSPLLPGGSDGQRKAALRMAFEQALERYFSNERKPVTYNRNGPENY